MTVNVTAWNNEGGALPFTIPDAYAAAYDLDASIWHMQVRTSAGSASVVAEASSGAGTATYSSGIATFRFLLASVSGLKGAYVHDFGFTPPSGEFVRVDGGSFTVNEGVTR